MSPARSGETALSGPSGSVVSVIAFFGVFGSLLAAFSPYLALVIAFVLSPVLCVATKGRYYLARPDDLQPPSPTPTAPCRPC